MKFSFQEPLRTYHALEGPGWRWKLAHKLACSKCEWPGLDDRTVEQAKSYVEVCASEGGETQAAQQYAEIAAARMLWQDSIARKSLMILTLGDVPQEEIAKRLILSVQIVATAELLFFDVRDRLDASSWILHQVILPAERDGDVELATMYRTAYWGGPHVAQKIVDTEGRVSFDGVQRLADQEFRLGMRAQAALAVPLDSERSKLRVTRLCMEYDCAKRRLELDRAKFRQRCEHEIRRHELAERRIVAKSEREQRARQRDEGVRDALARQQQAAKERAAESPLTRLRWSRGIHFQPEVPNESQPSDSRMEATDRLSPTVAEVAA